MLYKLSAIALSVMFSICVASSRNAFAQTRYFEPLDDIRRDFGRRLVERGVELTETALIDAMLRKSDSFATMMLATLPKTANSVSALRIALSAPAASDPDAPGWGTTVTGAAWALGQLGETGWEDIAIAQLPRLRDPIDRMNLAKVLANAGRADGWPIVRDALKNSDPGAVSVALTSVEYFDQLKDPSSGGQPIDLVAELTKLAEAASDVGTDRTIRGKPVWEPARTQLQKKIAETKARKEKK